MYYTFDWHYLNELRTMGNDIWKPQFKLNELHCTALCVCLCVCVQLCTEYTYAYFRLFTLSIKQFYTTKEPNARVSFFRWISMIWHFLRLPTANHVSYGNRHYVRSVMFGRYVLLQLLPHCRTRISDVSSVLLFFFHHFRCRCRRCHHHHPRVYHTIFPF